MPVHWSSVEALGLGGPDVERLNHAMERMLGELLPEPVAATAMMGTVTAADPAAPSNIVGMGVGGKIVDGGRTAPSIVVLVRHKVGPDALPESRIVPSEIDGFPTTVVETGDILAQFSKRRRPVPCGVSIGNCTLHMAGTLGCFVHDERDQAQVLVLSNNHVLALVNGSAPGTGIPQPGLRDGGKCDGDVIARLSRYIPVSFGAANIVDCAVAKVDETGLVDRRVLRTGGRLEPLRPPHQVPVLGAAVQKSGRTTGHTRGTVTLVGVSINVNMGSAAQPVIARFDQQFQVVGSGVVFSQPGDSGSLVTLDDANQPVGLLFAGGQGVTFCNDIADVLSALSVAILY